MTVEAGTEELLNAQSYFDTQGSGYKSWGHVKVVQVALRLNENSFLLTDKNKPLQLITRQDIQLIQDSSSVFGQLFTKRKNVNAIFITQQEFASQVKEEIPAILDDQAQLLGITVRMAKTENDAPRALSGRYAAILPAGYSICVGSSIEDAYVAAQLLEKTSKVFLEAKYLGGARAINKVEAWFMQQYYRFKYSKEAVKNK